MILGHLLGCAFKLVAGLSHDVQFHKNAQLDTLSLCWGEKKRCLLQAGGLPKANQLPWVLAVWFLSVINTPRTSETNSNATIRWLCQRPLPPVILTTQTVMQRYFLWR